MIYIFYTSLTLVVVLFLAVLSSGRITAACSAKSTAAQVGAKVTVSIEVTNLSRLPVPWVQCWVTMPAAFGLPGNTACYNMSLAPKEKRVITEELCCLKRGFFQWGHITLRTGDIFGFFSRISVIGEKCDLTVWPEVYFLDFELRAASGRTFAGIRSYQAGDSMNRIHWKASARNGSLLVKEYQDCEPPEFFIFLDLIAGHYAGAEPDSTAERAITLAASLAAVGIRQGYQVGLLVCAEEPVIIKPGRDRNQLAVIMESLARVNPGGAAMSWSAAADLIKSLVRGSEALLITGALPAIEQKTSLGPAAIFKLSGAAADRFLAQGLRVIPVTGQTSLQSILGGQGNNVG